MHIEPLPSDILDRLAEHRTVGNAPRAELEWLVAHGALRRVAAGEHLASKTPQEISRLFSAKGRLATTNFLCVVS
jgi:hypothetical protein